MEFLHGRPLSPDELDMIRQHLESLDDVTAIDPVRCAPFWSGTGCICSQSCRQRTTNPHASDPQGAGTAGRRSAGPAWRTIQELARRRGESANEAASSGDGGAFSSATSGARRNQISSELLCSTGPVQRLLFCLCLMSVGRDPLRLVLWETAPLRRIGVKVLVSFFDSTGGAVVHRCCVRAWRDIGAGVPGSVAG
jgi:hypothetical protein